MFPPVEMPECESLRMTLLAIIQWTRGLDLTLDKDRGRLVIVYDDMCHLLR